MSRKPVKRQSAGRSEPVSLSPLSTEDVLMGLLKMKPPPKRGQRHDDNADRSDEADQGDDEDGGKLEFWGHNT